MDELKSRLKYLKETKNGLFHKDFLLTWEKPQKDILSVLAAAGALKELAERDRALRVFHSGLAISLFRDKSTRTRMAYASACDLLGLAVQEMEEGKSQIAHGETVRETANMISFLARAIGVRDDMYLGRGHSFMAETAKALDEGFKKGVLHQRPSVINLQCDLDHPTQSMADLMHIEKESGGLENLRGKKFVMSWAYSPSYGKPLSVAQGISALMSRFGMEVVLAYPEGYDVLPQTVKTAEEAARRSKGSFRVTHDMKDAFQDADIVYPKSWAPYGVMKKRTGLYDAGDRKGLDALEKQCLAENARHKDWICDGSMMRRTRRKSALYMHCLPADISGVSCKDGEVTKAVFEKYRIATYREASYKPYVVAAMILMTYYKDAAERLAKLAR